MSYELDIEFSQKYRRRRNRALIGASLSFILFLNGTAFLAAKTYVSELLLISERKTIILGIVLLIVGLCSFLFIYLNLNPYLISRRGYSEYDGIDINTFFNRKLKKNLFEKYGLPYSDRYFEQKKDKFSKLFETDLTTFKNKFVEQSLHDLEYANLFDELYKLDYKIKSQIDRLENNSNLNLIIGIITTTIAIILLAISIFNQTELKTSIELASHYIPRVSTVIFVEIFSFFFLRLYKNNLSEIKYFQNEITNLNFKISSLKTAIKLKDSNIISEIIRNFSLTERNFILKKDESTEKIEIQKMDTASSSNYFQSLSELIKSVRK
ncbi:hypothetical protein ACI6Q2_04100 [Chitinophagaceae bacterium LWZ2-11]